MGKGGQDYGKSEGSGSSPPDKEIFPAWAKDVDQCLKEYEVDKEIYGLNELDENGGPSIWSLILEQFYHILVRILLAAVVFSFILAWYDGSEGREREIAVFVEPIVIFLILILIRVQRRGTTVRRKDERMFYELGSLTTDVL